MGYDIARTDYNLVAWILGGQDPRDAELRVHRRALATATASNPNPILSRVRQALTALDPRVAQAPAADCCAA